MPNSFATPRTVAPQGPLSVGFSRQEYWNELPFPFPGDLPISGIEPHLLHWQVDSLSLSHPEACLTEYLVQNDLSNKESYWLVRLTSKTGFTRSQDSGIKNYPQSIASFHLALCLLYWQEARALQGWMVLAVPVSSPPHACPVSQEILLKTQKIFGSGWVRYPLWHQSQGWFCSDRMWYWYSQGFLDFAKK